MQKVILYLAANPYDTATLPELHRELKEVKREIRHSRNGKAFDFQPVYAASPIDLRTEIVELRPYIVHFSGHGDGDGGIIFDSDSCAGESNRVTGEMLANYFRHFDFVECVVLNACYSVVQAEQLHRCVNYVIGIDEWIDDKSAREFSASFYNALGNGYSIESAFEISRNYLNMKKKPVECQPQLFKRKTSQPQLDANDREAALSVLDPFKDAGKAVAKLLTSRWSGSASQRGADAHRDTQTLMAQWVAVCTMALVLAAGISMGPASSLLSMFRLVAVVTSPLLQWMVIKNWMRNVPGWQWFFGTILGALCGWYLGEGVSRHVIDNVLQISFSETANLACWYEECAGGRSNAIALTVVNLAINSLFVGGAVGAIQGWLLRRSFLRVSLREWVFASMVGLAFGSLLGLLPSWYDASFGGQNPDDLLFALILGAVYGTMTGRVLLFYVDAPAEIKPPKPTAPAAYPMHSQLGFKFRGLESSVAVPAELRGSIGKAHNKAAERGWVRQPSWLVSSVARWLDVQRTSPRVANWALVFAVLAMHFTIGNPQQLLATLSALVSVYCVRQAAGSNREKLRSEGGKRVKTARFISYAVLTFSLLRVMFP